MKITAIKQQVKRQDRYSIFVDEKYSFSLSELALINSGLRLGQEVTQEQLDELQNKAKIDKGYNQALNLLARRARSEWELRDYLKRKDYDSPIADEILNRLSDLGYVDDLAFAKAWVENRRLLKATSKRRLNAELRQKRISDDIIEQVLAEDETDEVEVLRELVQRKRKQTRYQDDLKLMQYLSRQGYNYDDIKSALSGE
jgi:regulatory protein